MFRDLRSDPPAHGAAEHRAYLRRVAAALQDAVVVIPFLAGVADIVGIVLLAPPVCGRPWRRIRGRGNRHEAQHQERDDSGRESFHDLSPERIAGHCKAGEPARRRTASGIETPEAPLDFLRGWRRYSPLAMPF